MRLPDLNDWMHRARRGETTCSAQWFRLTCVCS